MEIGLENHIKNFAGGLGILAGDTLKSGADLGLNICGITLNYSQGYFTQSLDQNTGLQVENSDTWDISKFLTLETQEFSLEIATQTVWVRVFRYDIKGEKGIVPVYFLDTDYDKNTSENRLICSQLYTADNDLRLKQEILLGIGGVKMLEALGKLEATQKFHLNESHAAFAILALRDILQLNQSELKEKVIFTTHTPVLHGHKHYQISYLQSFLGDKYYGLILEAEKINGDFSLTKFCLDNAIYSNAVSKKHAEISNQLFPGYNIDFITNGVHAKSWTSEATKNLFDQYLPGWRQDSSLLRNALEIPDDKVWQTHQINKNELLKLVQERTGQVLDSKIFTIGFGRRVDPYKRLDLIFNDLERLKQIAQKHQGLQLIFSGKAFPRTQTLEGSIAKIYNLSKQDLGFLKIVYIPNYDMEVSLKMVSGSDIWLNNPIKPLEASGTSGMKAAMNGVPNLSILDGWWIEGWVEDQTGWAIGDEQILEAKTENSADVNQQDATNLYNKLEQIVLPTYFLNSSHWIEIQKQAMALNGSHFNTERMLLEYLSKGYISR
jgi:starch phosphorylase